MTVIETAVVLVGLLAALFVVWGGSLWIWDVGRGGRRVPCPVRLLVVVVVLNLVAFAGSG